MFRLTAKKPRAKCMGNATPRTMRQVVGIGAILSCVTSTPRSPEKTSGVVFSSFAPGSSSGMEIFLASPSFHTSLVRSRRLFLFLTEMVSFHRKSPYIYMRFSMSPLSLCVFSCASLSSICIHILISQTTEILCSYAHICTYTQTRPQSGENCK